MTRYAVLFDLDGTLVDSSLGITLSIQYALERMRMPVPNAEALRLCIGPPLRECLSSLLATEEQAFVDRAVALYRERYADGGLYESEVFSGVPELLARLKSEDFDLFLATSKSSVYASQIMTHFGLSPHFSGLYGSELDGRLSNKQDLIAHVMSSETLEADAAIMVGDRHHDLFGARANMMASIGVTYGFGSHEELAAEAPWALADTPHAVAQCIGDWAREMSQTADRDSPTRSP